MPSFNDIARTAVGDPSEEFPEAAYRAVASKLANSVLAIVNETVKKQQDEDVQKVMDNKYVQLFEGPFVSFGLAYLLELLPGETLLPEQRGRLAYNLRVQAYQGLDEKFLDFFGRSVSGVIGDMRGVIEDEISKAGTAITRGNDAESEVGKGRRGVRKR
jgi:hypothetical protein